MFGLDLDSHTTMFSVWRPARPALGAEGGQGGDEAQRMHA